MDGDHPAPAAQTLTLHRKSARHEVLDIKRVHTSWASVEQVRYLQTDRDGRVHEEDRELSERGDGVTTLLYHAERRTVLLLRQPRIVATLRGDLTGETLEACSGLLGNALPEDQARREVLEETGYTAFNLQPVSVVYGSPGGSLELIHLFLAEFRDERRGQQGGLREEGEDIETMELSVEQAVAFMLEGRIRDARTMVLLQHLVLMGFPAASRHSNS